MTRRYCLFLFLFALLFLAACSKRNIVVLMEDPDGSQGSVVVSNESGDVVMDKPYQATTIGDRDARPAVPFFMDKEEVDSIFSAAIAGRPEPPIHFILHFKIGSTELAPESENSLTKIMETIGDKGATNISVIGHTDTAGDKAYNLTLSTRRARAVAKLLIRKGVKKEHIDTTSHGERNPIVKTADNVSNPLNRRVEVIVR